MGQQVRSILEKMARAKIQQDHKEAMPGTRSWDGWTIKGRAPGLEERAMYNARDSRFGAHYRTRRTR
ncbi:hypothetical protein ISCGN_005495 [Ixodes scapularis]